jgi:hypothetical protein
MLTKRLKAIPQSFPAAVFQVNYGATGLPIDERGVLRVQAPAPAENNESYKGITENTLPMQHQPHYQLSLLMLMRHHTVM